MKTSTFLRLSVCLISLLFAVRLYATGPTLVTISDVVYRADGSAASGTMVINWPGFSTADGSAVAAGEMHVTIGPGGVVVIALAPNANSTPAGTYYKVVYKLDDGTTSTEYWVIPASGPVTIAAIRATVVPTQVAAQLASRQYVDSAVGSAVHIAGTESITGAKSFAVSPTAPDPTSASALATKNYVDLQLSGGGGGSGSFLPTAGGTMTGSLFLAADPTSPAQATTRHYVDAQTATLTSGIASRLSRIGDSPITLAGVRYADQFAGSTVGAQIDAACADLGGANGVVMVSATLGTGWSLAGIPSNCTVYDQRGVGGSTQTAFARGIDLYGRYTQVGSGLQIVSPMLLEFDAYSGGVNNLATTKTQWQGLRIQGKGRTIGERKGIEVNVGTPGKGDSIGIMASSYDPGGYSTGGDEGSEGGRFMSMQGDSSADGGFPRGTVAAVSSNTITGTWTSGTNANLGEQRPLINTSRGVYNTGSIASVTASGTPIICTVNGSGTSWGTLGAGAKTDLFLEINGNSNGATKHVVPITSITDDTHLVVEYSLAELGPTCYGPAMTTSGAYNIYKGGTVSGLAAPPSGSLNATAVNLASGGSNFVAGDTIQQPLGYNYHGTGSFNVLSRLIGEPQGTGVYATNVGSVPFRDAFRASGKFTNGISFDNGTLTGYGVLFSAPVTGGLMRSNDTSTTSQVVYNLLNSSGLQRTMTYDRSNDLWQWSGGQLFSATDQRIGIGTSPQPNTLGYLYYNNASWDGLILAPNATPSAGKAIFDTQVGGVPRLRVENARVIVNNGSDLVGYSDDRATQKWKITGADGTISGSTVNATSGFQVSGSALSYANIAGNVDTTLVSSANKTGSGTKFATGTGTYTSGDCVKVDASGNLVDSGSACGGGGSTYTAGNGIDVSGSVISAANLCVQTTVQSGDTLTANGNFATTCTIPANAMSLGTVIEIWAAGTFATGSAGANYFRVGVKFGSTTVIPYSGGFVGNSFSGGWSLVGRIICTSTGTTGTVEAQGFTGYANQTGNTNAGSGFNSATITVNTTTSQTLAMFLQDNITATGNSMAMRQLVVKLSK